MSSAPGFEPTIFPAGHAFSRNLTPNQFFFMRCSHPIFISISIITELKFYPDQKNRNPVGLGRSTFGRNSKSSTVFFNIFNLVAFLEHAWMFSHLPLYPLEQQVELIENIFVGAHSTT